MSKTLTIETDSLSNDDLLELVKAIHDTINERPLTTSGSEAIYNLSRELEVVLFARPSGTPAEALRKLLHLSSDNLIEEYVDGPAVVQDAFSILERGAA